MIKLTGGARNAIVHMVKLRRDYNGPDIHGKVLAFTGTEWVTWSVSSNDGGVTYAAYSGHYLAPQDSSEDAYFLHLEDFNRR